MPAYRNIIELNQIIDQIAHAICQPIELIFEMSLSRSPGKKICILRWLSPLAWEWFQYWSSQWL